METSTTPTRSDIDDILKRKRKVREHKACYPCRQRKVKCDSNIPCKTCMERNHADICAFNPPPSKRHDNGSTHNGEFPGPGDVSIAKDDWERLCSTLSVMERQCNELREDMRRIAGRNPRSEENHGSPAPVKEESLEPDGPRYVRAMEVNEQSQMTGQSVHLGGGSVPALALALRKVHNSTDAVQEVLENNVLPLFGLDNQTATYPFVDLWGRPRGNFERISELCKALPSDAECLEAFRLYRDVAHVIYPSLAELDQFESDLLVFLAHRRSSPNSLSYEGSYIVYGKSIQWLGLLFAAFASGTQFSQWPKGEREPISQVYVCCSFECLRLVNYISNASEEVVQSMLILGNVLANGMNAGAAWSLLGLTIRLAQSLGLHRNTSNISAPSPRDLVRSKIWWAVLWQDSLLSISYDRASSALSEDCSLPINSNGDKQGHNYHECMYRVLKVGLDTVLNRVALQKIESRLSRCGDLRNEIQKAQDQAVEHLRDLGSCKSIRDQSEYWMLYLHASYMKSELCRPAISPSTSVFDQSNKLRRLCVENLMNTVEAFLGIARVSPIHTRSWAVTHRALSSALLLGILGEPLRATRAQKLLSEFIETLTRVAQASDGVSLSAPIQRSISALKKLSALESRTPKQLDEPNSMTSTTTSANDYDFPAAAMSTPMNFDEINFFIPSPLSGFEDESSPYALMDSIIWGGGRPMA